MKLSLADLVVDARTLSRDAFVIRHGAMFLVGLGGNLRTPKRFEQTRSGPASPSPERGGSGSVEWLIFPVRKSEKSLSIVKVTVGRTANNDVQLEDASVSRLHAFLEPGTPTWTVRDTDSRLGTKVNGTPTTGTTPVRSGDQLHFGQVEVTLMDVDALVYFIDRMSPRG